MRVSKTTLIEGITTYFFSETKIGDAVYIATEPLWEAYNLQHGLDPDPTSPLAPLNFITTDDAYFTIHAFKAIHKIPISKSINTCEIKDANGIYFHALLGMQYAETLFPILRLARTAFYIDNKYNTDSASVFKNELQNRPVEFLEDLAELCKIIINERS